MVVNPHKHGLQPYGCGAVLFRDPGVARFYLHDSPYTYFTSADLHLGEISLECSRPGAAAAALWLTFRLLPPTRDGLGQVLAAGRRAALAWAALIGKSSVLELYQEPELDIVSYFPVTEPAALSRIDLASERILQAGMTSPDPVFLSTLKADAGAFRARHGSVKADATGSPDPAQRADETGSGDLPPASARAAGAARARLTAGRQARAGGPRAGPPPAPQLPDCIAVVTRRCTYRFAELASRSRSASHSRTGPWSRSLTWHGTRMSRRAPSPMC